MHNLQWRDLHLALNAVIDLVVPPKRERDKFCKQTKDPRENMGKSWQTCSTTQCVWIHHNVYVDSAL